MLIGLIGRPLAGKDTAAAVLQRAGWRATAFADALRIEVAAAWRVDIQYFTQRATKEVARNPLAAGCGLNRDWLRYVAMRGWSLMEPRSPRWVMQHWGEWRRTQRTDYWVAQVRDWIRIERGRGVDEALVITDVRHANEAALIVEHGGHLVRVHRPDLPALDHATGAHPSEQHHLITADADIHNDGDLQHLEAEVRRVVLSLAQPLATPL